jgi:hypothetical protein
MLVKAGIKALILAGNTNQKRRRGPLAWPILLIRK